MSRPLFKLDDRLQMCASYVRQNAKLVDVGTDHAYLPIWLYKSGKIQNALAVDINKEPLKSGELTIEKYGVKGKIETRLSNGLQNVKKEECSDVVIAGMGGELIASIIENSKWVIDSKINLILQPMSKPEKLREYLYNNNLEIIKEEAVKADGKIYSVIMCSYSECCKSKEEITAKVKYMGKLKPSEKALDKEYVQKVLQMLEVKEKGLEKSKDVTQSDKIRKTIKTLEGSLKTKE